MGTTYKGSVRCSSECGEQATHRVCAWVMEALGAQACDAIRDDKALPQTSTYLKAHSRARAHRARLLLRHGFDESVDR